jgi:hypothetical protein
LKLTAGDFWNSPDKFSLTVENISGKPVQNFALETEHFLAPQYLHPPFEGHRWTSDQPLAPHQQQTLEKKAYAPAAAHAVLGWAFYPATVTFADGTTWKPEQRGECFNIFWRDKDKDHPTLEVLPPMQREMHED